MSKRSDNKVVAYFYDDEIGNFYYGPGHPMKPHRMRMAHHLILSYGLYKRMEIFRPSQLNYHEMTRFHADDYIHFLQHVTPDNQHEYTSETARYNIDVDCPIFDGLYKFCQMYSGGSLGGAYKLNRGTCDVAVNWSGGLHHAKKAEASGFCYVNDIVLAVLELLKYHARVLYIDIDIHHGDGVEEAFYTTDRVMTVSFHKYGEYFPGTGGVNDIGVNKGKGYSVNFPLMDGIDDNAYLDIFKSVIGKVMERYDPGAIVLQCGADSLTGDRLGCFNLTLRGHAGCVEYMKSFNKPLMLLGGGGYTVRNVARCWAYETAVALGSTLNDELPYNQYYEYYGPDFTLNIPASNMENLNTPKYLDKQKTVVLQMLQDLPHVPSVAYSTQIPRDPEMLTEMQEQQAADEEEKQMDQRVTLVDADRRIQPVNEFHDGDALDRGDNDEPYLTKGTHRQPIDPATQFYSQSAAATLPPNNGGMDTT